MSSSAQLLIIGNGFDLHCGLQSSYKDFFRMTILDTLGEPFNLIQMKIGVSGFWEHLLFEYYKTYAYTDYNWCDIESIIQETLWSIFIDQNTNDDCLLKKALNLIKIQHITKFQTKTPETIENYIVLYCVNYLVSNNMIYLSYDEIKEPFGEHLLEQLKLLEKGFCRYLQSNILHEQQGINKKYIINAINLLGKLTGNTSLHYDDIYQMIVSKETPDSNSQIFIPKKGDALSNEFSELNNVHILSFNYTALFDVLLVDSPCYFNNVHGKLCNKLCNGDCNSNIIFGIDDTLIQSQIDNSVLRLFSKTYRKMFDISTPTSILPPNDEPLTIKFYGHSLSKADYSYFQSLFDYYDIYENNDVRLIFYHSKGYEQPDAIYDLINSYGKTLINKEQGKNLMHKLLLENRLNIVEID